jgi:hypothetical protein
MLGAFMNWWEAVSVFGAWHGKLHPEWRHRVLAPSHPARKKGLK